MEILDKPVQVNTPPLTVSMLKLMPIVQNVINGIKVCGKKADGLNLAQAQRPSMQNDGSYKCPTGT